LTIFILQVSGVHIWLLFLQVWC